VSESGQIEFAFEGECHSLPTERRLINPDRSNGRCVAAGEFHIVLAIWQTLHELHGGFD